MKEDKRKIEELNEKIAELMPEYNMKKEEYDKATKTYCDVEMRLGNLQSEIDALKKKIEVETFKKSVDKGELLSFRLFFAEIRKGRDFTGKTLVWSFKNGKSGMYVALRARNNTVSEKLESSYYKRHVCNLDTVIRLVKDFSSLPYDDFCFDAFTVGSMLDGRAHHHKKLDDVFIFICDAKTLDDFENIADTEGLYFFERLPYVDKSYGKTHKIGSDGIDYLSLGSSALSKSHYKNYKLYPLEVSGACNTWRY